MKEGIMNITHSAVGRSDSVTPWIGLRESPRGSMCNRLLMDFLAGYDRVHGYVAIVVCIVGVVANLANIIVLTRKNMLTAVNALLTAQAAAGACIMAVYLPVAIFYLAGQSSGMYFVSDAPEKLYYVLFFAGFSSTCHSVAIWETIAVASFRVICLCSPTTGRLACNNRRCAWIATAVVVIASFLVTVPNWLTLGIVPTDLDLFIESVRRCPLIEGQPSPANGTWTVALSPLALRSPGFVTAIHWLVSIGCRIVPSIALAVLTVLLVYVVRNAEVRRAALRSFSLGSAAAAAAAPATAAAAANRRHSQGSQKGRRENLRTTCMLLAVVCVFLLVELPHGAMIIAKSVSSSFDDIYNHLGNLIDLTALAGLSLNFFFYTAMSKQFRRTFVSLFCKRWQPVTEHLLSTCCKCERNVRQPESLCARCRSATLAVEDAKQKLTDATFVEPSHVIFSECEAA